MKSSSWTILLSVFLLVTALGCARPPISISSHAATEIEPLGEARGSTGLLVASVFGTPRDIEYFVNGVLIEPEEEVEWWKDARIELELRPGFYTVEGRYSVRAFAGRGEEYRVVTRQPVEVAAGRETHIVASIRKDWRGVPEEETSYFRLGDDLDEEDDARQGLASDNPGDVAAAPGVARTPESDDGPDDIVVRGGAAGNEPTIQITRHGDTSLNAVDDIVIRGARTPTTSQPGSGSERKRGEAAPIGLPAEAEPAHQELPAEMPAEEMPVESAPERATKPADDIPTLELEPGRGVGVSVLIQSDPSGAYVSIDERALGRTPLRVRLDPTADHVLLFERDGCGDYVRLLSSTGWQQGRSPSVLVSLHCP